MSERVVNIRGKMKKSGDPAAVFLVVEEEARPVGLVRGIYDGARALCIRCLCIRASASRDGPGAGRCDQQRVRSPRLSGNDRDRVGAKRAVLGEGRLLAPAGLSDAHQFWSAGPAEIARPFSPSRKALQILQNYVAFLFAASNRSVDKIPKALVLR
jgi:hypothetical protein